MPRDLPSGTVTFLFTDVEGSTRLLKQLRDEYGEVLADHRRLLRAAFATYDGQEIDTQGDAFFFAFGRARDAVAAAAEGQRALAAHDWPSGAVLRVRMGLHTAEPVVGDEGYTGLGVHRAARICSVGHGGQVLLSNATRELVEGELPDQLELRDLGEHRLKDLDREENIFELRVEGLSRDFPPLKAFGAQPAEATPFAGREDELAEAARKAVVMGRAVGRRELLGVGLAAAGLLAFVLYLALGRPGGDQALTRLDENTVGIISADTGEIARQIRVGASPGQVAGGDGAIWVTNSDDGTVSRIDSERGSVRQTIRVGSAPSGIALGRSTVWVTNALERAVTRIDPKTNELVQTITVGNHPTGVAVGGGSVWVANTNDGTVTQIDEQTGDPLATFDAGGNVGPLAYGFGSVWAADPSLGRVIRIDSRTRQVLQSINVGNGPSGVAAGGGAVWVANGTDGTVSRVDPRTNSVTSTVSVGTGGENSVAASETSVWASDETTGTLTSIDPASGQVRERIEVGNRPQGVGVVDDAVHVAVRASAAAHRGGTLRVVTEFTDALDPAVAYDPVTWAALIMTNDGLTTYRRVGGSRGIELVPALARALPVPTNGRRTYTFRLREGIRYSTGTRVRPTDFRFALERAFMARDSPIGVFLSNIVGAAACGPQRCDLSRGVVADDRASTVTFHLVRPDPDLPHKLALPFTFPLPRETPPVGSRRPVPATGPYTVVRADREQIRLVRNPRFREWSAAAQPAGIPDEITFEVVAAPNRRLDAVLSNRADLFWGHDQLLPERLEDLRTRFGSRLRAAPFNATFFLALNTRRGPFSDRNVRRALNYAVDRDEIVRLFGGDESARATCQVLPPGVPGYAPYCPYTASPSRDGSWRGPDLATARRLIAHSNTRGGRLTLVYSPNLTGPAVVPYVASVLRQLGYRVGLREIEGVPEYFERIEDPSRMGDAAINGWIADYAAPYGFINRQLSCEARTAPNFSGFCDPRVDRKVERALALQPVDPRAANRLWSEIDRDLVDSAPWLFLVNPRIADVLSERVGNYRYNPQWGVLLDQLWVR